MEHNACQRINVFAFEEINLEIARVTLNRENSTHIGKNATDDFVSKNSTDDFVNEHGNVLPFFQSELSFCFHGSRKGWQPLSLLQDFPF